MDGQRLAVEEVRSATNDLQLVDKREGGFFRFKIDGEDSAWQGAELFMGEFEEGIIFQTGVVDAFDLRQLLTLFGEPECGLGLTTETDIERVETHRGS